MNRHLLWWLLAVVAAAACGVSWWAAQSRVDVAPVAEGAPATVSVVYDPQWITLSLLAAAVAGVAVVCALVPLLAGRRVGRLS